MYSRFPAFKSCHPHWVGFWWMRLTLCSERMQKTFLPWPLRFSPLCGIGWVLPGIARSRMLKIVSQSPPATQPKLQMDCYICATLWWASEVQGLSAVDVGATSTRVRNHHLISLSGSQEGWINAWMFSLEFLMYTEHAPSHTGVFYSSQEELADLGSKWNGRNNHSETGSMTDVAEQNVCTADIRPWAWVLETHALKIISSNENVIVPGKSLSTYFHFEAYASQKCFPKQSNGGILL